MVSVFLDQDIGLSLRDLLDLPALSELAGHIQKVHQLSFLLVSPENEILVDTCSEGSLFENFLIESKGKSLWKAFPEKMTHPLPKRGQVIYYDLIPGVSFQIFPVILELSEIGAVAIGPFQFKDENPKEGLKALEEIGFSAERAAEFSNKIPKYSKEEFNLISRFLSSLLEVLIFSSFKRHLTNMAHVEAITESYKQLQKSNKELQESYEKLKEIDRMKSNFLAVVSHELRTPLTSVIGYSEMLLEGVTGDLNEGQQKYINVIMEEGEHLLHLIGEILNVSKIEAGQMKLNLAPLGPTEVLEAALETIRPIAEKKGLTLHCEVSEDVPKKLGLDREKLIHIYNNLLSNAVKFNNRGGSITLSLSLSSTAGPNGKTKGKNKKTFLLSSVRDTGVGISADQLDKIFEKFYQVDSSSTRAYGGTGLGLSIVKSFVEIHDGKIWAESKINKGTCFYFTLPIVDEREEQILE